MFWIVDLFATNLVWQCKFISWNVLWNGCFAVFKVKVTVKVRNYSEFLSGQYLWSNKLNMVMHHMSQNIIRKYYFAIFKVKATVIFTIIIFRNTETFTTQISLMIHHHKTGKTFVKRFSCFYSGCETGCGLSDCGPECCHSWPYSYLKQRSVLVPIKKMWTEHCFCNEYILVY